MAITPTPRFGLKQFSSGADPHPTRLEHNAMIAAIENNAALTSQGTLAARPTAGKVGRIYWATDTKRVYYDDGMAWSEVSPIGGGGAGEGVVIGGAAAEGTAERAARADHTHSVPLASATGNGAMTAADKKKLDAATPSATGGTLASRDTGGAISVSTPTASSHATTKAYVDGRINEAAEYADDAVYNIPFASHTEYGHMTAADKKKLDGATSGVTGGALVKRADNGSFETPDPTAATHVTNKKYVDAETAKKANAAHTHGAADLPNASPTAPGIMSAADKAKLDKAGPTAGANTLMSADGNGRFQAANPSAAADVANKGYVDGEVRKKANASHSHGAADLPNVSATAPGIMSAADKAKLDKSTDGSTSNTLMWRNNAGRSQVENPYNANDIANKVYVDGEVGKRALASHSHGAADLPTASATAPGIMSAADKKMLDEATHVATANTVVRRGGSGEVNVGVTSADSNAARKDYVDNLVATRAPSSHNHSGSNITSGTINPARIANVTQKGDGLMSAEDKTKLDNSTDASTSNTLMWRNNAGRSQVEAPYNANDIANKVYVDGKINTRAPSSHNHSGNQITSGTIPSARIANSTQTADGLMSSEDKLKLDQATHYSQANRIARRDENGNFNVANPTSADHAANKRYVDAEVKPLADNHVIHYHNDRVIAGVEKPAGEPWKHFFGPVLTSTGAGGATRTVAAATDANGYGGIWFGYDGVPKFKGILGVQMTTKSVDAPYLTTIAAVDVNTTRLKYRAWRQDGSGPANVFGNMLIWLDVWGW